MFYNIKIFCLALIFLFLSGCSFSPLYEPSSLSNFIFTEPKKSNIFMANFGSNVGLNFVRASQNCDKPEAISFLNHLITLPNHFIVYFA